MAQSKKDKRNVSFLRDRYWKYRDNQSELIEEWKYYYRVVKAQPDVGVRGYKFPVNRHIALMFVESFVSSVMNPLFAQRQLIDINPTERFGYIRPDIPDQDVSRQLEHAVNLLLEDPDNHFAMDIKAMVKSLAYFGSAVAQVKPSWRQMTGSDEWTYKGPHVELQQLYNVMPNPFCDALRPGVDLFIREIVVPEELRRRGLHSSGYKNIEDALKAAQGDVTGNDEDVKRVIERNSFKSTGSGPDRRILLIHYFDPQGNLRIMANNEVLVYNSAEGQRIRLPGGGTMRIEGGSPYPYYPFESLKINEGPMEFWGTGIAELSAETQMQMNRRASQRNENIELSMSSPFIASRYAGIDTDDMYIEPGKVVWVNEMDGLAPMVIPDVTANAYREDEVDMRWTQQIVSIPEAVRGVGPQQRTTATQNTQNLQSALERMSTLQHEITQMLVSVTRKIAVQIRSYMHRHEYERLTGRPDAGLYKLSPDEIVSMLDFRPTFKPLNIQEKQMRLQNLMQMFQMSAGIPFINSMTLFQDIVQEFFPKTDPMRYVMPPQQVGITNAMQQLGEGSPVGPAPSGGAGEGISPAAKPSTPGQGGDFKSMNPGATESRVAQGVQA